MVGFMSEETRAPWWFEFHVAENGLRILSLMVSDFGRGQSEKEQILSELKVFKGVEKQKLPSGERGTVWDY